MAHGRRPHDEVEARRCLLAAKRAGRSAGEWARAHGIDGRSLHAWLVNPICPICPRGVTHRSSCDSPGAFGAAWTPIGPSFAYSLRSFFKWLTRSNVLLWNPASEIELPKQEKRLPK